MKINVFIQLENLEHCPENFEGMTCQWLFKGLNKADALSIIDLESGSDDRLEEFRSGVFEDLLSEYQAMVGEGHELNSILILPLELLYLNKITLPAKQKNRWQQALPYILEDDLLLDTSEYHFSISLSDTNQHLVAAIQHSLIQKIINGFVQQQLPLNSVVCESSFLPVAQDNEEIWNFWERDESNVLELSSGNSLKFLPSELNHVLKIAADQIKESINKLTINYYYSTENPVTISLLEAELTDLDNDRELVLNPVLHSDEPITIIAEQYVEKTSLNILQGEYKAKRKSVLSASGVQWLRPLQTVAVLLGLIVFISFGKTIFFAVKTSGLKEEIKREYALKFPEDRRFARMRTNLRNLHSNQPAEADTGFLNLLAFTAEAINKIEKAGQGMVLERINYGGRNTGLKLQLKAKDVVIFEHFKKALAIHNLEVEISSAVAKDDGYQAQIIVKG